MPEWAIATAAALGCLRLAIGPCEADEATPAPPSHPPASPVVVRFLEPKAPALLQGPTRITIEAATGPEARIASVSLYANDTLLSVMEKPPFTLTWEAGRTPGARRLRAVAVDSLGRRGEAEILGRSIPIGQYEEVRLVNVYAAVRDARGRAVLDLTRDDFRVLEDGVPQTISHFSAARAPLTIAILIDSSNSMTLGGKIDLARRAAEEFVNAVEASDRLLVLNFDDTLHGDAVPSADRRSIKDRIRAVTPGGGTALYDAVYATAGILSSEEGRRAMVLLSDGRDQALTENEPGSLHLFEEALERAHRAEVSVYTIGLGRHLEGELDLARVRSLKEILDTLARQSGGRSYFPEHAGQLADVYHQIAADLRQQYTLAYTPASARDGRWHRITVETKNPTQLVQARAGYYAPGPAAP